jgi:hypothetical protein
LNLAVKRVIKVKIKKFLFSVISNSNLSII